MTCIDVPYWRSWTTCATHAGVQVSPHDTSSDTEPSQKQNYSKNMQKKWRGKNVSGSPSVKPFLILGLSSVAPLVNLLLISLPPNQMKVINTHRCHLTDQIKMSEVYVRCNTLRKKKRKSVPSQIVFFSWNTVHVTIFSKHLLSNI